MVAQAARRCALPIWASTGSRLQSPVRRALILVVLAAFAAGCGGSGFRNSKTLTIVVNASFSKTPYVADTIANGAKLGVLELPGGSMLTAGNNNYSIKVVKYDTGGSPVTAVANVRRAVAADAIAIVDRRDGRGRVVADREQGPHPDRHRLPGWGRPRRSGGPARTSSASCPPITASPSAWPNT